jgi:hypothetical protein
MKQPKSPKAFDDAILQLVIANIALLILLIIPELKQSPSELQSSNIIMWLISIGIGILSISKLSEGKTWARVFFIVINIILILSVAISYFAAKDIVGGFINHNPLLSIGGLLFLILSTSNLLKEETSSWFAEIRNQTPPKDRTRKFILGYAIVVAISTASQIAYEIDILEYVNSAYDAGSKLTYFQSLTHSTLTGNTKGEIITIGIVAAISQIAVLWAYYFVVFVVFGFISDKTKQSVQMVNNSSGDDISKDSSYYYAYKEIEGDKPKKGSLWAKAFALSGGDPEKQKAIYVKLRAKEIDEKNK